MSAIFPALFAYAIVLDRKQHVSSLEVTVNDRHVSYVQIRDDGRNFRADVCLCRVTDLSPTDVASSRLERLPHTGPSRSNLVPEQRRERAGCEDGSVSTR